MNDSPECAGSQHGACPGYYKTTHRCECPCHRPSDIVRYRCTECDETFRAWAPAQRHADEHGGARLEVLL